MSTTTSKEINYKCWFDHGLGVSCPGHIVQVAYHNTSDTVTIYIDNDPRLIVDHGSWNAILEAIGDIEKRWKNNKEMFDRG